MQTVGNSENAEALKILHAFSTAELLWSGGVAVVTGSAGVWLDGIPWSVSILIAVAVFCLVLWARNWIQTPSPEMQEKRDLLRRLCGLTYQFTNGWKRGDGTLSSVLNEIRFVFADNPNVLCCLDKMRDDPGHNSRDVPDLIGEMANIVGSNVDPEALRQPLLTTADRQKEAGSEQNGTDP